MNLDQIETKSFIMALFIRDDNERFLLGTGAYEFKDSQLHFAGNTIENDVVSIQGNDGYMLAGQVRRPNTQVFDGYIGDATTTKSEVEGFRRDFFAFFRKNHFYTVVYIMADGSAIQRRKGFLVDAPTVKELWQMYPEYHVGFNFEDINYYNYTENAQGEETYGKSADVGLAKAMYGGLIWEEDGITTVSGTGTNITLAGTMEGGAIESVELNGDTTQISYSGKNLVPITNQDFTINSVRFTSSNGRITVKGTASDTINGFLPQFRTNYGFTKPAGTYTFSRVSSNLSVMLVNTSNNTVVVSCTDSSPSAKTFTLTGETNLALGVYIASGAVIDTTVAVQLESGSTATSFEPYVGGTASPNPDYPQNVNVVTGEQSIWVRGSKNLFNKATVTASALIDRNDGSCDAAAATWSASDYIPVIAGQTYTLTPNKFNRWYTAIYDSNKTYIGYPTNTDTFTIPTGGAYIRTTAYTDQLDSAQLELGSATTYEPYKGVTKTVNLGKNLFDKDNYSVLSGYFNGTTNIATPGYTRNRIVYIPCTPNTTYSVTFPTNDEVYLYTKSVATTAEMPANSVTISGRVSTEGTSNKIENFTTNSSAKYLCLYLQGDPNVDMDTYIADIVAKIQIEKGSATTYAPYFTPIELCKIGTYQDYIYKSGEDWYVHKETTSFVLDGTKGGFYSSWYYVSFSALGITNVGGINMFSSNFTAYDYSTFTSNATLNGMAQSASNFIIRNTHYSDAAGYQTWLASTLPKVYYPLATPTDTQITNATLISELEDLLSATTYSGTTYITVSGDLASPLEVVAEAFDGGGVEWDANGAVWEDGGGGATTVVTVDSIDSVYPVWTVTGKSINPVLTNLTTAMSISYNGTIAQGQTLVVDLLNKTAKLNGTSVIQNISGSWVEFAPGNNQVSYTTDNSDAPDSTIEWQEIVG